MGPFSPQRVPEDDQRLPSGEKVAEGNTVRHSVCIPLSPARSAEFKLRVVRGRGGAPSGSMRGPRAVLFAFRGVRSPVIPTNQAHQQCRDRHLSVQHDSCRTVLGEGRGEGSKISRLLTACSASACCLENRRPCSCTPLRLVSRSHHLVQRLPAHRPCRSPGSHHSRSD
jgi:hypothetical protein